VGASKSVGYAIARPTPETQGGHGARSFASWTDRTSHFETEKAMEEKEPYVVATPTVAPVQIIPTALPSAVVLHISQPAAPTVNLKVTKNSKGYGFEATVIGATSPEAAIALVKSVSEKFEAEFGPATE
jgi:hypothetical protein